jgi:isoleucyl-tRNA synthetase
MPPEPLFARVPPELDFPKEERETLAFWKAHRIFEKTLAKPAPRGNFVFYEGPPTANGLPHNGHVLTRVIKDLFPRYRTMRGWRVPRKAGWDTHGLPVEVEVEKELRIHGKAAIEDYGVEPFVKKCIESVFRYTREWEELTERVAFWVDLGDAYVTYHRSYVESVWWALSELFKKGLLYQGHKVVWWWAQGGTALSSGEVGQGYRQVDDPSVYVAFPVEGDGTSPASPERGQNLGDNLALLVWTTTPWTLPSNMYAAVHPQLDYVVARTREGRRYILARGLLEGLAKKIGDLEVERETKGRDLVGLRYRPPFDLFAPEAKTAPRPPLWSVIEADFVTLDAGTGIVHVAPAFGEDDHEAHRKLLAGHPSLPLLCAVKPDGTFIESFERYAGRWVKDCDKEIQHDLKDRGLLVHAEQYRHDYPFCWRADSDPLIQYARPAWYIATTKLIDRAIANSASVHWMPDHIKEGRFGDFLANNVDWALSRERWWGTPLNVWVCDRDSDHKDAPASVAEIESRNGHAFDHFHAARRADPSLSEHLIVHKPWVDQVTFPCARCAGTMRRVSEVIDCWFDSGCMPFAQWGYPHAPGSKERFEQAFPADFISEAIDQTRGWFYSLLMISTLVFESQPVPHPFKTCIVLGHVTDKEGKKESKSKGNYTPPEIILDRVAMDFAVLDENDAKQRYGVALPNDQTAVVGWEDMEGLDLGMGASVEVSSGAGSASLVLNGAKKLPRRVVVLPSMVRAKLGVIPVSAKDVKPVEVPRLPPEERVRVADLNTPAPGADAFRWFFYAASPPWSNTRHSLSNVRGLQKEFAVKLRNVYSFFTIYAAIDGFDPHREAPLPASGRPELDRWILSELAMTTRSVTASMDAYDVFAATQTLVDLVDALSNWWVRRSRARFWRSGWDADKRSAYETLYECLVAVAKLTAPFTPYGAESMWQNLVVGPASRASQSVPESVHLAEWPESDAAAVDKPLSEKVALVRHLVSLGLQVRTEAKIKVRQPLSKAHVVLANPERLDGPAREMLSQELNVESVQVYGLNDSARFVEYRIKPNFRELGRRDLGKQAQELKKHMASMSSEDAASLVNALPQKFRGVDLYQADVDIEFVARAGFAAAGHRGVVVVLETTIDDRLRELGVLRELQNRVQGIRKDMALEYTDRIRLSIAGGQTLPRVVAAHKDALAAEVLAIEVTTGDPAADALVREVDVEGETVRIGVTRV